MNLMTERHRHILNRNRVALVRNVQQLESILNFLREDHSLTDEMKEEIEVAKTRDQKVGKLIDVLSRRSDKAFQRFLTALVMTHQEQIASQLDRRVTDRLIAEREQNAQQQQCQNTLPSNGLHSVAHGLPAVGQVPHVPQGHQPMMPVFMMPQSSGVQNGGPTMIPMYLYPYGTAGSALPGQNVPFGVNSLQSDPNSRLATPQQETGGAVAQSTASHEQQLVQDFKENVDGAVGPIMQFCIQCALNADHLRSQIIYPFSHYPRGRALVISNTYFVSKQLQHRDGAQHDETNVQNLFTQLHFEVDVQRNKTAQEMGELLNHERQLESHKTADAFVLFLLTHGSQGSVFGTDGEAMAIEDITTLFDGSHCEALRNKPKLFFIQACQGKRRSTRFSADGLSEEQETVDAKLVPGLSEVEVERRLAQLSLEDVPGYVPPLPQVNSDRHEKADMLISYATVKGYEAWRHSELGCWFVRSLIYVFSRRAHCMHIADMLTEANFLMSHLETQGTKMPYRQIAEKRDTLLKPLYFLPGYFTVS